MPGYKDFFSRPHLNPEEQLKTRVDLVRHLNAPEISPLPTCPAIACVICT
jgi:hypothetical protein